MRLPDCKIIEEMNRLRLNKISFRRKDDKIMDTLINSISNHKYIKSKKQ